MLAIAIGLIFSLFNVASPQDVPFRKQQQLQCLHHGSTRACLFFSVLHSFLRYCVGDNFQYVPNGFSANFALAEVLLMLYFVPNVLKVIGNEVQ